MKRLTAIILLFAMVITFSPIQALAEEGGIGGAAAAGENPLPNSPGIGIGTTGTGGANISTPFGYRGEYKDSETGNVYLRARYYSPGIGRFITSDPAKADGYNWYSYCGNDPVNFVDPSGLEFIVVSGGAYKANRDGAYNHEFIETGIRKIRDLRAEFPGENITWLIAETGWTEGDAQKFINAVSGLNINVKMIKNKIALFNYINYKDGTNRNDDKITKFVVFSHGFGDGTVSLGYNYSSYDTGFDILKGDIDIHLQSSAFNNPNSCFYSCNTGTGENSFAQLWVNKVGGKTWAFVGKSNYEKINAGASAINKASRKINVFSFYGSVNYPTAGSNAYMTTFMP